MAGQASVQSLAGEPRLAPYLEAASGHAQRAADLYLWANELAGALHSTIAHVEIGVRNAISPRLGRWNAAQGEPHGADWALHGMAAPLLYELLGEKKLRFARDSASDEARRRPRQHPRFRAAVTNDDVIAQLTFGTWVRIVAPVFGSHDVQERLWEEGVKNAFPGLREPDRVKLGQQLERVRRLRNRVAHHDNLLGVEVDHRLNDMLAILRAIDPSLPALAMARSRVRAVLHADPRRSWTA